MHQPTFWGPWMFWSLVLFAFVCVVWMFRGMKRDVRERIKLLTTKIKKGLAAGATDAEIREYEDDCREFRALTPGFGWWTVNQFRALFFIGSSAIAFVVACVYFYHSYWALVGPDTRPRLQQVVEEMREMSELQQQRFLLRSWSKAEEQVRERAYEIVTDPKKNKKFRVSSAAKASSPTPVIFTPIFMVLAVVYLVVSLREESLAGLRALGRGVTTVGKGVKAALAPAGAGAAAAPGATPAVSPRRAAWGEVYDVMKHLLANFIGERLWSK